MHDVQSDSVGLLKQVMVMLLLQSAIHHGSRMRLYYWLRPTTHRAVKTAEEAGCELRPSPLVEWAVLAPGRSSKGGGALEFELPKTAETAAQTTENKKRETGLKKRDGLNHKHTPRLLFNGIPAIQGTHEPAAVRRSERLVAALAPPPVSARLVRCAGHFWPSDRSQPAARRARQEQEHTGAS
jgi:hypothetical protein